MEVSEENSSINLIYFQGTGSIWNNKEWRDLRRHRVVGHLVGNLGHQPHQVKDSGFPLMLTKNETTLLLEKGFANLIDCQSLLKEPDDDVKEKFKQQRQDSFYEQVGLLKERRKAEILERADLIVKGKLLKRRRTDPENTLNYDEERALIIQKECCNIPDPAENYLYTQICTEEPWTRSQDRQPAAVWSHPSTDEEKLEYAAYRTLWESGYWVTPGGRFGGHFLAYPGDPLLFHAHFIVRHIMRTETLDPLDIIAFARLANSTRKTAVLAYSDASGIITFQSLSWLHE